MHLIHSPGNRNECKGLNVQYEVSPAMIRTSLSRGSSQAPEDRDIIVQHLHMMWRKWRNKNVGKVVSCKSNRQWYEKGAAEDKFHAILTSALNKVDGSS
jgi:hypothetical protein